MPVKAQDKSPLATAADQRGEQTIHQDAKTAAENVTCSISNARETNNYILTRMFFLTGSSMDNPCY